MNYIAHIQLASVSNTSLLGNFLGDFVKGSELSRFSEDIAKGIRLHRFIDSYTDKHKEIICLRQKFPENIRRMAGVIIDVYYDHLLCEHWSTYENRALESTLNVFYCELETHHLQIDQRYQNVREGLLKYRWLENYRHFDAVVGAFKQIEKRLEYKIIFSDDAGEYLLKNACRFRDAFNRFYPDLVHTVVSAKP